MCLKGLFTICFLLSFKSHILDSNGVWYSWFWPEGSINPQNSTFLGFHFVPRDLDSRRKGPRLATQGTSTRGAMGPWLKSMAPRVEVPCAASRGPLRRESRSLVAPRVEVPGDKMKTQKCWVLGVYRPLRPKSAIPHPITTQNMRFERYKKNWWTIPLIVGPWDLQLVFMYILKPFYALFTPL